MTLFAVFDEPIARPVSVKWEGEAGAEPHTRLDLCRTARLGGSLALPKNAPSKPVRLGLVGLLLILWVNSARAETVFTAQLREGKPVTGPLQALTSEHVTLGGQKLSLKNVLRFDAVPMVRQEDCLEPCLILMNGDRLIVTLDSADQETLRTRWTSLVPGEPCAVPWETARGLLLQSPSTTEELTRRWQKLHGNRLDQDVVWLSNADLAQGELTSVTAKSLQLTTAAGKQEVSREGVRAIAFNPDLASFPVVPEQQAWLSFRDGTWLTANQVTFVPEGELLDITAAFGGRLKLPLSELVSCQFRNKSIVYLSELEPVKYRQTPYLGLEWLLMRNRSARGGVLTLADREYRNGLGLHSHVEVTYTLEGRFAEFRSRLGIDRTSGTGGSVVCKVLGDGKVLFTSSLLRGGDAPVEVRVPVKGLKTLTLIAEFAEQGDVLDLVDWCDAVVIRKSE